MFQDLIKEITDSFVAVFARDEDYEGWFARLACTHLPRGVDPNDPRVKAIQKRIKERAAEVATKK